MEDSLKKECNGLASSGYGNGTVCWGNCYSRAFRLSSLYPSQTLGHYLVHVEYGSSQVPLAGTMIKQLLRDSGKSQA